MSRRKDVEATINIIRVTIFIICVIFYLTQILWVSDSNIPLTQLKAYLARFPSNSIDSYDIDDFLKYQIYSGAGQASDKVNKYDFVRYFSQTRFKLDDNSMKAVQKLNVAVAEITSLRNKLREIGKRDIGIPKNDFIQKLRAFKVDDMDIDKLIASSTELPRKDSPVLAPFFNSTSLMELGILALLYVIATSFLTKSMYQPIMSQIFGWADFLFFLLLVFLTGGLESPFIILYFLPVINITSQYGVLLGGIASVSTTGLLFIGVFSNLFPCSGEMNLNIVFRSLIPLGSVMVLASVIISYLVPSSEYGSHHIVIESAPKRSDADMQKYQKMANQAQNFQEMYVKRQREIYDISELMRQIISEMNLEKLLPLIIQKAAEQCDARIGALLISNNNLLRVMGKYNLTPITEEKFNCIVGEGLIGQVAKTGQAVSISKGDNRLSAFATCPERIRSIICVPIKHESNIRGAMVICNKLTEDRFRSDPGNDEDLRSLEIIAGIAATALENASLFKRIQINLKEIENKNLELEDKNKQIEKSIEDTITTLAEILDARDTYTREHSKRVCRYSVALAGYMGISSKETELIRRAAMLHDIGKIAIPDRILLKPEGLTDEEYEVVKTHSTEGAKILANVEYLKDLCDIVKHHHEKFDGTGYPDGLKGNQIPLLARIIAVADTYDAMTCDRPYRKGFPPDVAIDKMAKFAAKQVGTDIFIKFQELMEARSFNL